MKKLFLLAVCTMAAMTSWAQEEEELVTTMVITRMNGTQVEIPVADVKEITFEEKESFIVPTTPDEAKAMLVGQWKCADDEKAVLMGLISMGEFAIIADEACIDIMNDKAVIFIKLNEQFVELMKLEFSDEPEMWEMYGSYYEALVGTYVALKDTKELGAQNATPNETDPTQGTFGETPYSDLSDKTLTILNIHLTRVTEPITYGELGM